MQNNHFGYSSSTLNTTGNNSLAFGFHASKNIFIGLNAGVKTTTGSFNILIGDDIDLDYPSQSYLFRAKDEDGNVISFNMSTDTQEFLYRTFIEKGLKAMLGVTGLHLPKKYKNVIINQK